MKLIIKILILASLFINLNAYTLETYTGSIVKAYNSFIVKLESKLELKDQLKILESLSSKLNSKFESKTLNNRSLILFKELFSLNDLKIQEVRQKLNVISYIDNDQITLEKKIRQSFNEVKDFNPLPYYISNLISINRPYLFVINNNDANLFEFLEKDTIKRIIFINYYEINEKNYDAFKPKNGYILNYKGKYIFVDNYSFEEKVPYSESTKFFKSSILNPDLNYHEENGKYYFYKLSNYISVGDKYGFYPKTLEYLGYNLKDLVLYKNKSEYVFFTNYTEDYLIKSSLLDGIVNKNLFLSFLYDDKATLNYDTDIYFAELKTITKTITAGLSKDEKIKAIYNWILKNITYTNPIDLTKREIFSGIDTFKNKEGVCEGYAKLTAYMLMFAGIEDIDVIRGYVINAQDFPKVGHAWLKIGTYYYDPTFDDPIGNTKEKSFDNYQYYKLPGDLFYTNRYDVGNLPEELKTKSKTELEDIVNKNIFLLVSKYKNMGYNLLKYPLFLYNSGFAYNEKLTISKLEKLTNYYSVNGKTLSFIDEKGNEKFIKNVNFYPLTEKNIMDVLNTINFDLNNKYVLKWDLGNGNYEYRIAYNLELF